MNNVFDIKQNKNLNYILPLDQSLEIHLNKKAKVAIVIHLYYLEGVERYFRYVESLPSYIDVFFTVSDGLMREKISEIYNYEEKNVIIIEKQNRGRDISALLVACRKEILKYDYLCFLHDKREKRSEEKRDVEKWIQCLWENMIGSQIYIENIIKLFEKNSKLGLLVPPFPLSEHFATAYTNTWGNNFLLTKSLAERMGLECDLDSTKPPITLGTVFWTKVSALRKLFEIEWDYKDFDEEPLRDDGTISHAVERILAYVAQDAGYDTGWVMTDHYAGVWMEYMQTILSHAFNRLNTSLGIWHIAELISYENRLKEMLIFIDKYKNFYIYGAGNYGKKCLLMLKSASQNPVAFIVSAREESNREFAGVPVLSLSEIELSESIGIIIAVGKRYQNEVLDMINSKRFGFTNIYIYKNE